MKLAKNLALAVILGSSAYAMADFDFEVVDIGMLQAKEIQKELGITEAQRAALNHNADWFNAENKKLSAEAEKYAKDGKNPQIGRAHV